jgi:DNA-binding PadR family transcriptional regulator
MSQLPPITHLQFLVLEALADGEQAGRGLRGLLASYNVRNSAPAFYQMMGRLEETGYVEGWYDRKVVAGQHIKERRYRLTRTGGQALADTQAFYRDRGAAAQLAKH